jgi:hypothetical protein
MMATYIQEIIDNEEEDDRDVEEEEDEEDDAEEQLDFDQSNQDATYADFPRPAQAIAEEKHLVLAHQWHSDLQ